MAHPTRRRRFKRSAVCILVVLGGCGTGLLAAAGPPPSDTPVCISGIYPHLAVFNGTYNAASDRWTGTGGECGIGAVVPWAGKLWMITYPPHETRGGRDKLWSVDARLNQAMHPESVGGTHAGRMIHRESNQLIIGPYFIDAKGSVRAANVKTELTGRMTAVARHLTDPKNMVYFFDMEGAIYEVNVHTVAVKKLFAKPVPGDHGKGGYTGQGRLIIANNGERRPKRPGQYGVLAEWDGREWRIVERKQFCDVTGPGGIYGAPDDKACVWASGWDRKSVILKLLDSGTWHTFRMPKASHTFDAIHGWYTEWPRIREVGGGKMLMVMHGMMYDFPAGFCAKATGRLRPIASHLRYIPDFCDWNGRLVLASDDASTMGNPMVRRAQSNVWFGKVSDLPTFGPASGWGGVWLGETVAAGQVSDPFLVKGFAHRVLHLATGAGAAVASGGGGPAGIARCSDKYTLRGLPRKLRGLARVTIDRRDFHKPAPGYAFAVDRDVTVYIAVDARGDLKLGDGWERTSMTAKWGNAFTDVIYSKAFAKGTVTVPPHDVAHKTGAYGLPHLCFVAPAGGGKVQITDVSTSLGGRVWHAAAAKAPAGDTPPPPTGASFTIEIDRTGDGTWTEHKTVTVGDSGYAFHIFEREFDAAWVRIKARAAGRATAYFHYASPRPQIPNEQAIFAALPKAGDAAPWSGGLIRPASHNTNLQFVPTAVDGSGKASEGGYLEVDRTMAFASPDDSRADEVKRIAAVRQDFTVDAASVIMTAKGRRYRLPKGHADYDEPFAAGPPRGIRECVSERYLANIHGTFYELPRSQGMHHPGLEMIKPVASHGRKIVDFCTWRGLMVLSGTRAGAKGDGNHFATADGKAGLWFGSIDDLWRLGKPVGTGGPWRDTAVTAGAPSDAYLMTGYDRKRVEMSHDADGQVTFTIEVNFDHNGFHRYKTIPVPAGKKVAHAFPAGFNAHWVRVIADKPCKATAWFVYE